MTLPPMPAATIARATRCVHSSTWRRLDRCRASQPFSLVSRIDEKNTPPALLTRIDDRPELVVGAGQRGIDGGAVAHVGGEAQRTELGRGRRAGVRVLLPDGHRGAEGRETCRDAAADAGSGAGHDGDPALEQHVRRFDRHGRDATRGRSPGSASEVSSAWPIAQRRYFRYGTTHNARAPMLAGRPRDGRIDAAVRRATVELLEQVGVPAADDRGDRRAGRHDQAGHLPTVADEGAPRARRGVPRRGPRRDRRPGGDLRADIRALVVVGLELLGRPAARAALPGLLAETAADPTLQADVLGRAAGGTWAWLQRPARGRRRGRRGARRRAAVDGVRAHRRARRSSPRRSGRSTRSTTAWVDDVVDLIMRGIAP